MSRYQKGKTNLDFTEARDSEWQRHQLGCMQVCISLQTDNHASTPPLSIYRPDALPAAQPTVSKHRRHKHWLSTTTTILLQPFNGLFSRTTWVSRYQKGKTIWILLEQKTVSGSGISWAICKSAPRSRQITTPVLPPLCFLQAGCPSCRPTNSVKALKAHG